MPIPKENHNLHRRKPNHSRDCKPTTDRLVCNTAFATQQLLLNECVIRGTRPCLSFSLPSRCSEWHAMGLCHIFSSQPTCERCLPWMSGYPTVYCHLGGAACLPPFHPSRQIDLAFERVESSVWKGDLSSTPSQQGSQRSILEPCPATTRQEDSAAGHPPTLKTG